MPRTPRNKENKEPVIIEDVKEPEPEPEPEVETEQAPEQAQIKIWTHLISPLKTVITLFRFLGCNTLRKVYQARKIVQGS